MYLASAQSRAFPMVKVLLSSFCTNSCKYCALRCGRRVVRTRWNPEELVNVTLTLWCEGRVQGLFLSSSVDGDPDFVVLKEIEVAERLRQLGFTGYIHLRLMPGCSRHLVERAAQVADRIGVNLEAVSSEFFSELCPDKGDYVNDVLTRLKWCSEEANEVFSRFGGCRSGVDTQFVVGALGENDSEYIKLAYKLLKDLKLRRVYFSGFEPIKDTPLEKVAPCPSSREYALYQASYLLKDYGFKPKDLEALLDDNGFLPRNENLKLAYAAVNRDFYPVDLGTATYHDLLKVPGIGPRTARAILFVREYLGVITFKDLVSLVGGKRARLIRRYVTSKGKPLTAF